MSFRGGNVSRTYGQACVASLWMGITLALIFGATGYLSVGTSAANTDAAVSTDSGALVERTAEQSDNVSVSIPGASPAGMAGGASDVGGGGESAGTGRDIELVYSNTNGGTMMRYPPGPNERFADDARLDAICGCTLANYKVMVDGGGDGTGAGFPVELALWDACPNGDGEIIPGTEAIVEVEDDGEHLVTVDVSGDGVAIPRLVWVSVEFDNWTAGWLTGEPAEIGVSLDWYDSYFMPCTSNFSGTEYFAGFYMEIYCEEGPPVGIEPSPQDGAESVLLDADLAWSEVGAGGGGRSGSPVDGGEEHSSGGNTIVDPNWPENLEPGQWCGTYEHYLAKNPLRADGGMRNCPTEGFCDEAVHRDAFVPTASTSIRQIDLHMHLFCTDSGSSCVGTYANARDQIQTLNADFLPWRIQFDGEISFHNDTEFRYWDAGEEWSMKNAYADSPDQKMNVYVVDVSGGYSFGTFPWDSDALTFMGGVVLDEGMFAPNEHTLTHEIGHCLGLWHTFHGVTETTGCSDPCYENAGTDDDDTGDFCSDTDPTPRNYYCNPPGGNDPCNGVPWGTTPYHNYMGYAPSYCLTNYTVHQAGRMQCWGEDALMPWLLTHCNVTYDVYFGEDNPPSTLICDDITDTVCDPGTLEEVRTYYWQVVTTDQETGEYVAGPVWSFTTVDLPDAPPPPLPENSLGITDCTSDGDCANEANCVSQICYAPKHRYISIARNPGQLEYTARRIKLVGHPDPLGWVGAFYEMSGLTLADVVDEPVYVQTWPDLVNVKGCEIATGQTYLVASILQGTDILDEIGYSDPIELHTPSLWGDVVETCMYHNCTPPQGEVNIDDILAGIAAFQSNNNDPLTWFDIAPALDYGVPNQMVDIDDILATIQGFQSKLYPGLGPLGCD